MRQRLTLLILSIPDKKIKSDFAEGAGDGQGGSHKGSKGRDSNTGKTTVMAPVANQINIDLGDQVAGSIQKRLTI
jgi:hypothetical protein